MAANEDFTFIDDEGATGSNPPKLFGDYLKVTSGKLQDPDAQLIAALRAKHPELTITTVPKSNTNFLQFAAAGFAQAELDDKAEPVIRWHGFVDPRRRGGQGSVAEGTWYARYNYHWNNEHFILYVVVEGMLTIQYVLKEPRGNETPASPSSVVLALIAAIGKWRVSLVDVPAIYVYDNYWFRSPELWKEVEKAKWDDVILDPKMKKAITTVAGKFFDSKDVYQDLGVPWKRGLIWYGPAGNGKTISLKALMHTVMNRDPPVVTLYVKSAAYAYDIQRIMDKARSMAPCLLVLEDIDTIVTAKTRSYFFNEVDGLENNDGIMMIATTNYLEELDPGLSKRPSRFDRKYFFPNPDTAERLLYAQYWRNKLKDKKTIEFPAELCDAIADITEDFSFAYLKEAFVATLLELARDRGDDESGREASDGEQEDGEQEDGEQEDGEQEDGEQEDGDDDDPLDKYEFWRIFKAQIEILREELGGACWSTVSGSDHFERDSVLECEGRFINATGPDRGPLMRRDEEGLFDPRPYGESQRLDTRRVVIVGP